MANAPNDAVQAARSRLNQIYFRRLKLYRELSSLTDTDGTDLQQMKDQIRIVAEYGSMTAAKNLEWVLNELSLWHSNAVNICQRAMSLVEENYKLKTEAQVRLRNEAEFVLGMADSLREKQVAQDVIDDVNEWIELSAETLAT